MVNPTAPVGPGDGPPDARPGRWSRRRRRPRAAAICAYSALNVVSVEDVAAATWCLERGRAGERYLLGGEDLSLRDVFTTVQPRRPGGAHP